MSLKDLIVIRPEIAPVKLWAAVGTPKGRGSRWIDHTSLAPTMQLARAKFIGSIEPKDWNYWAAKGWSIERVEVSALREGKRP